MAENEEIINWAEALGADVVIPVSSPFEALQLYQKRQHLTRQGKDPDA